MHDSMNVAAMPRPETMISDEALMREVLRRVLGAHGVAKELEHEGMRDTPKRMLKALRELTDGYAEDPSTMLTSFAGEGDQIVVVRDIEFASLCEHHILPFTGTVSVAYIPSERIVGLSKIPRVIRAFSRRLQVQERLTVQIAKALDPLNPVGVAVVVRGVHECCQLRGAERRAEMVTSHLVGKFRDDPQARAEVLGLLGVGR